ncbi:hypothetical protein DFA_12128 [Cavenderia fasciculata]|uniref:Leucine-rich repeat-containing protein n=1 Tax=Cavenderia fasciculata TaxID=261658 RepID=F4QC76_CACFS|nr:uncharacterized protein DFA_12128 [Cavenderia fasciculata]EGG14357.1 hypothetical protein DFA_12128 [Cavenderia fasciculata]|eukprot:XP_004351078.1 hypothetical protein DFA_12128 [Cavenderia fasciculata]
MKKEKKQDSCVFSKHIQSIIIQNIIDCIGNPSPTKDKHHRHITTIKHINIGRDYVELYHLIVCLTKPFKLESLRSFIILCNIKRELGNDNCRERCDYGIDGNDLEDWMNFRLELMDQHPKKEDRWWELKTLNRLSSSFIPIWDKNNKIELVGLTSLPQIISPLFFTTLVNNQTITTLMLTNGTLRQEYIPSFSQLILSNCTIKRVGIKNNHLESIQDLEMAFKQNKSIKVLDVSRNHFGNYFFASLLESDTIQYLVIDETMNKLNNRYFKQSKSLIQFYIDSDPTHLNLFFPSLFKPKDLYYTPSLLE